YTSCFLHAPATPKSYTLSLHDALPIWQRLATQSRRKSRHPARAALNSSARGLASAGARARGQRPAHTRPTQARPRSRPAKRHLRSEEHTSELQSPDHLVCRLLLEKKNI